MDFTFLEEKFDEEKFTNFIEKNFEDIGFVDTDYTKLDNEHIVQYKYLGESFLSDDTNDIGFYILEAKDKNIENKRVGFNTIINKLASDHTTDCVIVAIIHPDSDVWRLTFVSYDEDHKLKTNAKRYTYVLGQDISIRTAREQLSELLSEPITQSTLELAFSVERVTKEFFDKYKNIYKNLLIELKPHEAIFRGEDNLKLFTKKLLGRIVFLYFLQKKGWLASDENWENGDKKFLSNCFANKENKYIKYDNFYADVLQPIFFDALNEKREDDIFTLLNCKMPFLNGGLFHSDEFDRDKNKRPLILIENTVFENIFETFDSYNFTIIEDSPLDSEIAIDPEMLGRVFEDLLEDRKDKGAFYTPREIVHYMCKKSIENYLETQLKEYRYDFSMEEFLDKTTLDDEKVLQFYTNHPMKFLKIDNYFKELHPYKNLVVDFFIVAKLRGYLLNSDGTRTKKKKIRREINHTIWSKILKKEYEVVSVIFGSNKEIKLNKVYKYPTILQYIQIEERYFALAFFPNINGDLELSTIFQVNKKEIKRKLKNYYKALNEINENNFVFDNEVLESIKKLREDCRSLHAEPLSLFQVEELPRQAVAPIIKQGLSTFHNFFNDKSVADENLKKSLKSFNHSDKYINTLLSNSNTPQEHLKKLMLIVLNKIKVLDPAIGSGAFPMGILHEIMEARIHLGDKTNLGQMKRKIIQNSIYGIDIEPSAVEIAKLRFWLSIVVDEVKPTPLPNLFYKIMVGNSLIETIDDENPLKGKTKKSLDELKASFDEFYNLHKNKDGKKNQISAKLKRMFKSLLETYSNQAKMVQNEKELKKNVKEINTANLIVEVLNDLQTNHYSDKIFLYKLFFRDVLEKGGFDVVIGNPPYVRQEKIKELKSKKEIQAFDSYCGTADLYIYFFEKGYKLLKPNGVLSYITSNKYTRAKYGKDFRKFVLKNTNILEYVDFNGVKVFESATVDTSIMTYKKSKEKDSNFIYCDVDEKYKKGSELDKFIDEKSFDYLKSDLNIEGFSFLDKKELQIKKKIEKIGISLKFWNISMNRGATTGFNEAFVIDGKVKDELISKDIKSADIIKPLLRGRDIKRYSYEFADKWIIGTFPALHLDINKYPAIKEYLEIFGKRIYQTGQKGSRKKTNNKWFETQDATAYYKEFENENITWQRVTKEPLFCMTKKDLNISDSMAFIVSDSNKYLMAILNSKTLFFYVDKISHQYGTTGYLLSNQYVNQLPIPQIPKEQQKPFEILVDYILFAKEQDMKNEASLFESIIDGMVYDLYFEDDMKKANCFITSRVEEIVKPFGKYDNDNDKNMLIKVIYDIFREDKSVQRGLIFSRNIEVVKIINGDKKDD